MIKIINTELRGLEGICNPNLYAIYKNVNFDSNPDRPVLTKCQETKAK